MFAICKRRIWLRSTALGLVGLASTLGFAGNARADSLCAMDPVTTNIVCHDPTTDSDLTAYGNFAPSDALLPNVDGLHFLTEEPLDVTLIGTISTTGQFENAVYFHNWGTMTFDGTQSVIQTSGGSNMSLNLRAFDLVATTGTVINTGWYAYGVFAAAHRVNVTGGTTIVGPDSVGIFALGRAGNSVLNTGTIYAGEGQATGAFAVTENLWGEGCGTVILNATGDVTGGAYALRTSSCSSSIVNVEAGNLVQTSSGVATIKNEAVTNANVTVAGTVSAGSSANLAIDQVARRSGTQILRGGIVLGSFDGTDGIDSFSIAAGGAWTTQGLSNFGAGVDTLSNAGTLSLESDTIFVGLERLNNYGSLSLAAADFSLPGTEFRNIGVISAITGPASISGFSLFSNAGTLDLRNGVYGDILTISGAYNGGLGSSVRIDAGDSGADRLVIDGPVSGVTRVLPNIVGSPVLNQDGILVVSTGGATPGRFVLGRATGNTSRLIKYRLDQQAGDYYLFSSLSDVAIQPLLLGNLSRNMWRQSAELHRIGLAEMAASGKSGLNLFGYLRDGSYSRTSLIGSGGRIAFSDRHRFDGQGSQLDLIYRLGPSGWAFGLSGGYQRAVPHAIDNPGNLESQGRNLAASVSFASSAGFYAALLANYSRSEPRLALTDPAGTRGGPDVDTRGIDSEVGYRISRARFNFDVHAGFAATASRIENFTVDGFGYEFHANRSLQGRIGGRAVLGGKWSPYVDASIQYQLGGKTLATVSAAGVAEDIQSNGHRNWGRLELGFGGHQDRDPVFAGWAEIGDAPSLGLRTTLVL